MKYLFLFLNLSSLVLTCVPKNKVRAYETIIKQQIDSFPNNFAISVSIIQDGKQINYGFVKENNQYTAQNLSDSLFEIGSITKTFTSTLLSELVESKEINLDDHINDVFPYSIHNNIPISYLSLSNHTSALPRLPFNIFPLLMKNKENPYSNYSYELLDNYLENKLNLMSHDSTHYEYSNLGAGALAYALSKRTNTSFESLLSSYIFNKYSMHNTGFDLATSFQGIGANNEYTSNWQFNAMKGAGGIISTTNDLSKLVHAHFSSDNSSLERTRKETFSISENMSIGLAWHIMKPNTPDEYYWHNGGTGGYTSSVAFRTSDKTAVIILSNISALHKDAPTIDKLCFELLDI